MILSRAHIVGKYRYSLERRWAPGKACLFIMLNPSTADATKNDPTIRRCLGFTKAWGFDAMTVGNIFAYRATDPQVMRAVDDPVGPLNDESLLKLASEAGRIVCAWGNHGTYRRRGDVVRQLLDGHTLYTFRITNDLQPMHPLYQPAGAPLVRMT